MWNSGKVTIISRFLFRCMKIIERSLTEDGLAENDYQDFYSIIVNGTERLFVRDGGESEDFSLGRDLKFVYKIVDLMSEAYKAGKSGEEFEVTKDLMDKHGLTK